MASPGNQNQQPGGGPFDVQRFFNPASSPPPISSNPNFVQNPNPNNNKNHNIPYPVPSSAASYPPPSVTAGGIGGAYSYAPQTPIYHPQFHISSPSFPPENPTAVANLHHQRSVPYSTPPLQPPSPSGNPNFNNHSGNPNFVQNPNPNPNHGARLMALLSAPPPTAVDNPSQLSAPMAQGSGSSNPVMTSSLVPAALHSGSGPMRMLSSKLPKGRHLGGDRAVYDIDVRLPGEVQPQLEVTPITKYGSDPGLVVGRQIAVNKSYICYGLKLGAIRVLNINTALRSLFKGLAQRVTDMVFFAEDVHLLASASIAGRVYVWKITEGTDEDDKPQIMGKIVIAIQIVGEGESVHPRVCWHCHKQEVLVVGIGKRVLRIDTTKVGRGEVYSAEEPLICPVDKLINGVQFVGNHDGEVTDLSMCQWMTTRLVSASVDGTIKIWEDRKSTPIAVLRPHDGLPVNSATFLTAPHRPDHIILITGGPLNREVKIWASDREEGWLLPSDADSWHCLQTLELKSSSESRLEDAFFNQVVALPQAGLLVLANAKKNAIYAVHLEYGPNPEATHMDYIAEFTVTMPILSFTGTSDVLPHGEQIVQVYCVQTQAIQQYALDLSQCLPPPVDNIAYDKQDSVVSNEAASTDGLSVSEPYGSKTETSLDVSIPTSDVGSVSRQPSSLPLVEASIGSPPVASSPTLTRELSDLKSPVTDHESGEPKIIEYSVDKQMNAAALASDIVTDETKFKHPTHLVTPAELMATSSSEINHISDQKNDLDLNVPDVVSNISDLQNVELEVKEVGETGKSETVEPVSQTEVHGFASQASDFGRVVSGKRYSANDLKQLAGSGQSQTLGGQDEREDSNIDVSVPVETPVPTTLDSSNPVSSAKGKKQKGKNAHGSNPSSVSPSVFNSTDSSAEPGVGSSVPSIEAILPQLHSMQETITQVLTNQKEIQKQIPGMVAASITKECRRIEAAIGKTMEKTYKTSSDALWARTQEEFTKLEKSNRERSQQLSGLVTNGYKDLPAAFEKMLKKETSALAPAIVRLLSPVIEKTVSTAITEAFQRGVADKLVNQLEKSVNSKLETTIGRQIQTQFQTSGKQALQEALKSSMEASVIPAFEMSCKTMFDQVNATFQKGVNEHTTTAQQQIESAHSPLAVALRDAINSASSLTKTLSGDLADGQRKLVALALAGANSESANPLTQLGNGPIGSFHEKIEAPLDPTKELSRLVYEHKYEEAFTAALQRSDVWIVSWLCSQVDLQGLLASNPLPLSQGVLLSLLQQLACDIGNDTAKKLAWMMDVVVAIKPSDSMIAMHVRPIFDQVHSILNHQMSVPTTSVSELSSIRVVMKLINSTLRTL
ncbi:putative transcription factor WD40-like family [Helianthus annuus]|uniref:Putative varicose-related protein n=1 Tax=Helianthus annuus TaxID=4232 RepID=A0A251SUE0_HELAN|nr:enhancer of mRNA-decapping protein 4 [Helianthus annuus]KAF5773984.1 putative transcription factor WD40-like family [Helianthus annuus]KAJ0671708.1 putative transcription factor WD40-like family [Helianthus annuus]KAJ0849793.1 putative transcription factor WD40-like family [Helianthus annuus]